MVVRARQDGNDEYAPAFAERSFDALKETMVTRPVLSFSVVDGLRLTGRPGATYRVESAESLRPPLVWSLLKAVTLTEASSNALVLPASSASSALAGSRFYRAVGSQ